MTKEELMARIRTEWTALMDVVARLSDEQMVKPDQGGWSPKDNLAHLSEWMKILMGCHMDKRSAEEVAGLPADVASRWDFDEINAIFFERNRERPAVSVLNELQTLYAQVVSKLEGMPFEELMKPMRADDPEHTPLLSWVLGDTAEHFEEHRQALEKSM